MSAQKNRVFITGGSRGIGKSIALSLAKEGYEVIIAGRGKEAIQSTLNELQKINPSCSAHILDVSDEAAVQDCISKISNLYGLVCCAGIYGPIGSLEEISAKEWRQTFEINVFGSMYCAQAAIPVMKKNNKGRIILFGGGGQGPMKGFSAYVSTKGAIGRFCETLGAELYEKNIFVNSIAPGFVMTELQENVLKAGPGKAGQEFYNKVKQTIEAGGGASPELSSKLVSYLLSDQSSGLWGKLISAQWDRYENFKELEKLSLSDLYTFKRVVTEQGGTRNL